MCCVRKWNALRDTVGAISRPAHHERSAAWTIPGDPPVIKPVEGGLTAAVGGSPGCSSATPAALPTHKTSPRSASSRIECTSIRPDRARLGLCEALAWCRAGDTLVVTKLDRLARSLTDARNTVEELTEPLIELNIGGSLHDPTDPVGRLLSTQPDREPPPGMSASVTLGVGG